MWKIILEIAKSMTAGKDTDSVNPLQLINLFSSAGSALSAQASLHAQLAQVEWEEEKQRLCQMAIFSVIAFAFFLCFLLVLSAFAIALSWDTPYRIPVFIVLILAHLCVVIWAGLRVKALAALSSNSFAATRAEIAADIALLKSVL
ncbi:hypothetical protein GCM10011613_22930 [Cellvibrio zantedeschiae]|uniref:Phage holin family protein n=1 Tax=Cellvibrio zantedeschiae TaxID=1237077 RepID=A0ABQ3B7E8_9GAMM|nr:phage holin family protein [Cellvibrio zantedeschiae]GGY77765.1 hypothetical protein GCM10011613_22930 [Cellvibrio zantedeschiae]